MILSILFEDDVLIAIDKPAGVLSIADRFDAEVPNLAAQLKRRCGEIFIIHRLDRETSGVILFAKTADAHRALNGQMEAHTVYKRYEAVVDGRVHNDSGTIDLPTGPDPKRKGLMRVDKTAGKKAVTHYTVLQRYLAFTHLSLQLETGRQHQIRVHCAAIGHPLTVDASYGARAAFCLSTVKRNYHTSGEERPLISRLTLHSTELRCTHPITSDPLHVIAPMPKDMAALLKQLEHWNS